jgi:hypothetical protein
MFHIINVQIYTMYTKTITCESKMDSRDECRWYIPLVTVRTDLPRYWIKSVGSKTYLSVLNHKTMIKKIKDTDKGQNN